MKFRLLGKSGPRVPAVGLGAMSLAGPYGTADEQETKDLIDRAIAVGANHIDTAESYNNGRSEELVAGAIAGRRDQVFLATKFGGGAPPPGEPFGGRARPEKVREAIEGSLRRLNVEYVDLYYLHRVDPDTPIEDTVGAMADLVKEGKVRYLGLSEAAPDTVRRACAVHPITALQTEYSMFTRDPEGESFDTLRELGVGFTAYSPLGRGILTGNYSTPEAIPEGDGRRNMPRFQDENLESNAKLVASLGEIADGLGLAPSQLAIAWVLAQNDSVITIPGTKRIANLESNATAADIELSADTLKAIDDVLTEGQVQGTRYPERMMGTLNV